MNPSPNNPPPGDEARARLGLRLLQATEAAAKKQRSIAEQMRQEQAEMKQQIEQHVSEQLADHAASVQRMDQQFSDRLKSLENRLSTLQHQWQNTSQRIDAMMHRAEAVMDRGRTLVESADATRHTPQPAAAQTQQGKDATQRRDEDNPATHDVNVKPSSELYSQILSRLRQPAARD